MAASEEDAVAGGAAATEGNDVDAGAGGYTDTLGSIGDDDDEEAEEEDEETAREARRASRGCRRSS